MHASSGVPEVSVVIPTCARPDLLARCLSALDRQTLPRDRFEIVVIDDSRTRDGPATARNHGWRRARAPVIAFTDDDTAPAPDWLEKGLAAIARADAVTGRIIMPIPGAPSALTDYERDARGLERAEFVTANCFVRRRVLEALGGFDEAFRLPWREDSDLQFRLLDAGACIVRAPDVVVVHPVRPGRFGVSLSQQRKIMFDALLYRKHPRRYRERIRAHARWDYYAMAALLVAALAAAALGAWTVGAPLLTAWALLTARFFLQRLRGTRRSVREVADLAVTSMGIPPLAVFWQLVGAVRFRTPLL
jgi:GT2 family glycosyltransferase